MTADNDLDSKILELKAAAESATEASYAAEEKSQTAWEISGRLWREWRVAVESKKDEEELTKLKETKNDRRQRFGK